MGVPKRAKSSCTSEILLRVSYSNERISKNTNADILKVWLNDFYKVNNIQIIIIKVFLQ